ncbi:hypothetical protein BC835DRAFT_156501 [Cytidiella melzeri]|nr:hypothetical protein BC835DRAFT_156501 [Cytidiella melzeri]
MLSFPEIEYGREARNNTGRLKVLQARTVPALITTAQRYSNVNRPLCRYLDVLIKSTMGNNQRRHLFKSSIRTWVHVGHALFIMNVTRRRAPGRSGARHRQRTVSSTMYTLKVRVRGVFCNEKAWKPIPPIEAMPTVSLSSEHHLESSSLIHCSPNSPRRRDKNTITTCCSSR